MDKYEPPESTKDTETDYYNIPLFNDNLINELTHDQDIIYNKIYFQFDRKTIFIQSLFIFKYNCVIFKSLKKY